MSCFDCALGASVHRINVYMRLGGSRIYIQDGGDFHVSTIVEMTAANEVKLRDPNGETWTASPCRLPHTVFGGLA